MLPLKGIRVLDLTRMVAGAYCSMILADLGAEVIKIEQPRVGDDTRQWGPPFVNGESAYFFCVNRNKKSLTLDLRKEKGKEIFRGLVGKADVVLENFRTGTMERYGLGYEALKKEKPDLIYCSITGFGLSGPYKNRPGTDPVLQAIGGLYALIGEPDKKPYRIALPIVDMSSGLYAHGAILAALIARGQDRQSHFIEISLLDNVLSLLLNLGSTYLNTGEVPTRQGNSHPSIVPFNVFEAKDRDVFLTASADSRWKKLCQTLGLEGMIDDPRFATTKARIENRREVERLLQERLKEKTAGEWMAKMDETGEGTPFAPINTMDHVFADPHVKSRDIVVEIEHPVTGKIRMVAPPVHYDGSRCEVRMPPPRLGEHTGEILGHLLGYDQAKVAELQKEGIL
jgi:crotonobetainyl-CoA:carnitine CoA-transferase CaiB-like acyl-CoA transferase